MSKISGKIIRTDSLEGDGIEAGRQAQTTASR
jgi:hypothetical protein